jgi:hypothetical protein
MASKKAVALFLAAVLAPAGAMAQAARGDTFVFRIGGFFPNIDTHARADSNSGLIGTTIDFETDLGLEDSKTLPILDATWRFLPHHRLQLSYPRSFALGNQHAAHADPVAGPGVHGQ